MIVYLEHAHGSNMNGNWEPKWRATHGETRSASNYEFHIGLMLTSNGEYCSTILATLGSGRKVPVEGTFKNWGSEEPQLLKVLNYYKELFGVTPSTPLPEPEPEPAAIPDWMNRVYADGYGGWFYIDEDGQYVACDSIGNPIVS